MAGENINTYQGDPGLAQGTAGGQGAYGIPELKNIGDAVDKLMYYNFLEAKDKWARRNLLADEDAKIAAEMSQYDIADWLIPEDSKAAFGSINDYNATYKLDPTAVRLVTDKNGKVINGENYLRLQAARNKVLYTTARANARTSKLTAMRQQLEAVPANSPQRKIMEDYINKEMAKPIDQDLVSPPEFSYFDGKSVVGDTLANTIAVTDADVIREKKYWYPNVPGGVAKENVNMLSPNAWAEEEYFNKHFTGMQDQIKALTDAKSYTHDDAGRRDLMADLAATPGGRAYA